MEIANLKMKDGAYKNAEAPCVLRPILVTIALFVNMEKMEKMGFKGLFE